MSQRQYPFPQATIAGQAFAELYPNWEIICQHFERAIAESRRPRKYMADANAFLQFFTEQVRMHPDLGIDLHHIKDLHPFVHDEFFGMGVIRPYLEQPGLEDVIMDSWHAIDLVGRGQKTRVSSPFEDDQDAYMWVARMAERNGKLFSENNPILDGQLPDGSRISAECPPVAPTTGFTIRRHQVARFAPEAYEASGVAPAELFAQLHDWVRREFNIVVCGATGSGKTTLLNYLASQIDPEHRVLIVEDTRELAIQHPRARPITAVSRGANTAKDAISVLLPDLVKKALRMRPDRIVVGEVRGEEAFYMLEAFNTGHRGGLSTMHANSPSEAISRLEGMAARAQANMPLRAIQTMISQSIDIIVQISMVPGTGKRAIVEISQIYHPHQVRGDDALHGPTVTQLPDSPVIVRQLWLWDPDASRPVQVAEPVPLVGEYFS